MGGEFIMELFFGNELIHGEMNGEIMENLLLVQMIN